MVSLYFKKDMEMEDQKHFEVVKGDPPSACQSSVRMSRIWHVCRAALTQEVLSAEIGQRLLG